MTGRSPALLQHCGGLWRRGPIALALLLFALGGAAQAQEGSDAGKKIAGLLPVCMSCHGPNGVSQTSEIPSLAGQHEGYLYDSLLKYQSPQGVSAIMKSVIGTLSDEELRELAAYFARLPYVRKPQNIDASKIVKGREVYDRLCQLCHRDAGRSSTYAEYPLLAGQSLAYMQSSMALILKGDRKVDLLKREMLDLVTPEKIDDAIHFFASQVVDPSEVNTSLREVQRHKRRRFIGVP